MSVTFFSRCRSAICSTMRALFTMNGTSFTTMTGAIDFLDRGLRPNDDAAAATLVSLLDALPAADVAAGREVRTFDDAHQIDRGCFAVVDQMNARVDDFAQIVRRDVRRHTDGDAAASVDQEVGKFARE